MINLTYLLQPYLAPTALKHSFSNSPQRPLHTHSNASLSLPADQGDESLRKWKESLGLGTGNSISDPKDPRKVIIFSLGLEVEGRPDIIIDLTTPGALEALNKHPFTIKEGATFRMKARFKVQHQILSGLKYVQVVHRGLLKSKMQEMIVSSGAPFRFSPAFAVR